MRLRNIPAARPAVENSKFCIKDPTSLKGQWAKLFGNDHPLHIEIGMGKGRFVLTHATEHPDINYLGLERYESVMYRAVQKLDRLAEEDSTRDVYQNLRLICCDAAEIADFFEKGEVEKIYLNFSDPWPKARHAKRRLTSQRFLSVYEKVLPNGGEIEFKTDNGELFAFSREELDAAAQWSLTAVTDDLHGQQDEPLIIGNIMTEYEEKFVSEGKPIHKLIAVCHA